MLSARKMRERNEPWAPLKEPLDLYRNRPLVVSERSRRTRPHGGATVEVQRLRESPVRPGSRWGALHFLPSGMESRERVSLWHIPCTPEPNWMIGIVPDFFVPTDKEQSKPCVEQ
jgi:hypothetical protein